MKLIPQQISGAIRRMMRSEDWGWRYQADRNPVEARAAQILQTDYARAAQWLDTAGKLANMPLPYGNGTNGPWQRVPHITPTGNLGIMDIAAGVAIELAVRVPHYVARFAVDSKIATSIHQAGGSGNIPAQWRQILVVIGKDRRRIIAPRKVVPLSLTWGYTTCYGTAGRNPFEGEYVRPEFAAIKDGLASIREADTPQSDIAVHGVQVEMWKKFLADNRFERRLWACSLRPNCSRSGDISVIGARPEREEIISWLQQVWPEFVMAAARMAAATSAFDVLTANGTHVQDDSPWGDKTPVIPRRDNRTRVATVLALIMKGSE